MRKNAEARVETFAKALPTSACRLCHCCAESKKAGIGLVKHWEIVAADRSPRNPAEDFLHYSIGTVGCLGI